VHAPSLALPLIFAISAKAPARAGALIEPQESDGELVVRAKKGDRWAEEALYRRHVSVVTRLAQRLLARSIEAEDVVQDTFVTAFGELRNLRDEDAFAGWLARIAVHQVHRRFRRRKLLRAFGLDREEDDLTLALQVDPAADPETVAALRELDRWLARLGARERIAWTLRHVEGHKLEEVAAACDCSLATAKRAIASADRVIRAHVAFTTKEAS
jgi:RNA polymerase sigma-70 factor (ECF subfamily)